MMAHDIRCAPDGRVFISGVDGELVAGGRKTGFITHIDANENVMLPAGGYGAAVYDGESWTRIAGDVSALDLTRLRLMERQVEDIRALRDIMRDMVAAKRG